MPAAYISLGSNIEPERNLPLALPALGRIGNLRQVSQVYESEAVGPSGQPAFLNAAVRIDVEEDEEQLLARLRAVEAELGRVRTGDKFAPRTIDLDLVAMEHYLDPDVATRAYLAVTLAEIAPQLRVGRDGEPIGSVAERLRRTTRLRLRPDVALRASSGRSDPELNR
jgi:2-amino-4-hydroxy-6-hydroxymethyldihydropteridine diphosphokinase